VKRWFEYPPDQYDEEKCMGHVLYLASKALHNFRSYLNNEYMKKRKTPFEDYNYIKRHV
jgi:hypothetical protein